MSNAIPTTLDEEFNFYLGFTKPLVLTQSNAEDRVRAAVWIKQLINEEDKNLRLDYLRLLLFALQRPNLIGPFKEVPSCPLEQLPSHQTILEKVSCMLENEQELHPPNTPKISTAVSHDLTEYASCQEIPNFGVQCYFATSPVSLHQWELSDQFLYPRKHSYGAEAWEQSLAQLYHSPLNIASTGRSKTELIMAMDCCKKKQRCQPDLEGKLKNSLIRRTFKEIEWQEHLMEEPDHRGPRSPWPIRPTNQTADTPHFTWDKHSRLDSSYNIQPTTNMNEGCLMNDHGVALSQDDQLAMLLARKNVLKKKDIKCIPLGQPLRAHKEGGQRTIQQKKLDACLIPKPPKVKPLVTHSPTGQLLKANKEARPRTIQQGEPKMCHISKPSYDPTLMLPELDKRMLGKNKDCPKKLKVQKNSDEVNIKLVETEEVPDILILRAEAANTAGHFLDKQDGFKGRSKEQKGSGQQSWGSYRKEKVADMKRWFDQRIPEPKV